MNEFKLSKRLACVAGIINPGGVLADIGTDHGYLPVHVAKNNIASKVIAMDVRKKPLEKAAENIKLYGVSQKVELRLSDGLYKLAENEADTITICGMGGKLIQSILENSSSKISENTQLILSPQSEIREFRKYLSESGYETVKEYMISEDGQFYVIIDCRRNGYKNELICTGETEKEVYYRYGEELLKEKNKSLREYLLRELRISQGVRNKLENINNDKIAGRLKELDFDLECIKYALEFYK